MRRTSDISPVLVSHIKRSLGHGSLESSQLALADARVWGEIPDTSQKSFHIQMSPTLDQVTNKPTIS